MLLVYAFGPGLTPGISTALADPCLHGRLSDVDVAYSRRHTSKMNLLDLIFPKRCVGCGKFGTYFCPRCISTIKIIQTAICPVCDKSAIDGATHPGCKTRYALDGFTSFFRYDGVVRKAIKAIKYRSVFDLAQAFVDLVPSVFFSQLPTMNREPFILVPIPLHPSRFRERGFNQSEVMGHIVAKRLHVPVVTDILRRVKKSTPQVEMKSKDARLKNMDGVFAVNADAMKHRRVDALFLLDDVFTTGATMRAAANVLKRAGAPFVWGITMAR